MTAQEPRDWTTGPAKLVAVAVLGSASVFGLGWSIATRAPRSSVAGFPLVEIRDDAVGAAGSTGPREQAETTVRPPSIVRLINLNTASAGELELLPGIGPALAERIIQDREQRGAFRSVNDLDRVSGIGPRTIQRLRDKVTVE